MACHGLCVVGGDTTVEIITTTDWHCPENWYIEALLVHSLQHEFSISLANASNGTARTTPSARSSPSDLGCLANLAAKRSHLFLPGRDEPRAICLAPPLSAVSSARREKKQRSLRR